MKYAIKTGLTLLALTTLNACGYVDKYEEAVHEWEPTYCYQQLAGVQCFREPIHRDAARLVNYYGPHPSRYDAPSSPNRLEPAAPRPVDTYVMDEEPVLQNSRIWDANY